MVIPRAADRVSIAVFFALYRQKQNGYRNAAHLGCRYRDPDTVELPYKRKDQNGTNLKYYGPENEISAEVSPSLRAVKKDEPYIAIPENKNENENIVKA